MTAIDKHSTRALFPPIYLSPSPEDRKSLLSVDDMRLDLIHHACTLIRAAIEHPPAESSTERTQEVLLDLLLLERSLRARAYCEACLRVDMVQDFFPPDAWTPVLDQIDTAVQAVFNKRADDSDEVRDALPNRLIRAREYARRGDLLNAMHTFPQSPERRMTEEDCLLLVELAIDGGSLGVVERLYREHLGREIPRDVIIRCADIMWRRFRDLLPTDQSWQSNFAEKALALYLGAEAIDRAQRLAYQLFDLLTRKQSYPLWARHEKTLFAAFEEGHLPLPVAELVWVVDWALHRKDDLLTRQVDGEHEDDEAQFLQDLAERISERLVRSHLQSIGVLS